jgi:competence protein ComFB
MGEKGILKNYMELCVDEMATKLMKEANVCSCENCKLDVMAMALNVLPPKYVVTTHGELFTKINMLHQQYDVDIVMELSKAIEVVKNKPRHYNT